MDASQNPAEWNSTEPNRWRERLVGLKPSRSTAQLALVTVGAVLLAMTLSLGLIVWTGGSAWDAVNALYTGSMASTSAWSTTLLYVAPLLLVAIGSCVSMRGGIFNIGQEGQVLIGALAGSWVALRLALPGMSLVIATLVAATVAGALWAGLSSLMYRLRGVNIVVSTLLMTFVAIQIVGFAVSKDWWLQASRIGDSVVESQSNQLPANARMGSFGEYPNIQINGGLIIALLLTVAIAMLVSRSRWGLQLKMMGLSPIAAKHAGVKTGRLSALALTISGATAGLAGAILVTSPVGTNRLQPEVSNGIGWDGLLIVLVARSNPLIAIPVALLFGMLRAGGGFLASTGVPSSLVDVMKALLVLAFVVPPAVMQLLEHRRKRAKKPFITTPVTKNPTLEGAVA
ncbi:ABC transporter permease [Rhodococcus sp. IEGM 1318]|uniref:ABC transporter permease n=1 Tax=Rhodococcus sp. IEGM 1318 TaxID=3082226 RepID=UPI002955246E|nr:ABC transporter permease [Rhodococcus sp. IEGM 1318]MDV8009229.1 ABC transporter permease [Rhodococcus sp. IEGM 1318]